MTNTQIIDPIDNKFKVTATNPYTGKTYTEEDGFFMCAHDLAVPAALKKYIKKCVKLGADKHQIEGTKLLLERVVKFQENNAARCKVADVESLEEIEAVLGKILPSEYKDIPDEYKDI